MNFCAYVSATKNTSTQLARSQFAGDVNIAGKAAGLTQVYKYRRRTTETSTTPL
jgi:hypothetical protein